ncbi:MAG: dodecin family protein [Actinomycetota bacterium]|nr:dodecin family protein [Actinomycetota bacterium]
MVLVKITELKSSSTKSFEDAIQQGIMRSTKTLRHVKSAWVKDFEVKVDDQGQVTEYRVLLKISFVLDDLEV